MISVSKISRLRTYSDGDGVSTLIGCMGCPLRCAYCFNPFSWDESIKPKRYTVDELYDEVKKDNIYFLATGGGLVFGGGEPLLYHDFIKEFIEKYRPTGWKFTLETSLSTKQECLKDIIPYIDYFIVDTKDMDKNRYELYTKGDYDLFLSNLKYLLENVGADKIRVRVPKIPKLNTLYDVRVNSEILKGMGFREIEVFNYIEVDEFEKISEIALRNKQEFVELMTNNFIKDFILSEIVLKVTPLIDFHIKCFPGYLWKNTEFIFEFDSVYGENLYDLKEAIISRLCECYDYLDLEYSFYVILYPVDSLVHKSFGKDECFRTADVLEGFNQRDRDDYLLKLWEKDKWGYLEFKNFCRTTNKLSDYFDNYTYELDPKYILSNSYEVFPPESEIRIFLNKSGEKYNIVEYGDATHVLVQKLDIKMEVISQEISMLNR